MLAIRVVTVAFGLTYRTVTIVVKYLLRTNQIAAITILIDSVSTYLRGSGINPIVVVVTVAIVLKETITIIIGWD